MYVILFFHFAVIFTSFVFITASFSNLGRFTFFLDIYQLISKSVWFSRTGCYYSHLRRGIESDIIFLTSSLRPIGTRMRIVECRTMRRCICIYYDNNENNWNYFFYNDHRNLRWCKMQSSCISDYPSKIENCKLEIRIWPFR